jgi:hypothetical protein
MKIVDVNKPMEEKALEHRSIFIIPATTNR